MSTNVEEALSGPVAGGPITMSPVLQEGGQPTSRTAVRWCLGPEARAKLVNSGSKKLYLFLVVVAHDKDGSLVEVERHLVDLMQVEEWFWFQYAGANHILAQVVWPSDGKYNTVYTALMEKTSRGRYRRNVLQPDMLNFRHLDGVYSLALGTSWLRLDIDAGFFPKPRPWLERAVGLFYRDPRGDVQCDLRRHALGVIFCRFWLSLLYVPLLYAAQLLMIIGGNLLGLRSINYRPVRHPYACKPWEFFTPGMTSRWIMTKDGKPRRPIFWVVNPAVAAIVIGIIALVSTTTGSGWTWALTWVAVGVVAIAALALFMNTRGLELIKNLINSSNANKARRRREETQRRIDSIAELSCEMVDRRDLSHPGFWVRWDRVKARVCRGWAKNL